jgi:hypothetical protein
MNSKKEKENRIILLAYVNEVNRNQRYWKIDMNMREEYTVSWV